MRRFQSFHAVHLACQDNQPNSNERPNGFEGWLELAQVGFGLWFRCCARQPHLSLPTFKNVCLRKCGTMQVALFEAVFVGLTLHNWPFLKEPRQQAVSSSKPSSFIKKAIFIKSHILGVRHRKKKVSRARHEFVGAHQFAGRMRKPLPSCHTIHRNSLESCHGQ